MPAKTTSAHAKIELSKIWTVFAPFKCGDGTPSIESLKTIPKHLSLGPKTASPIQIERSKIIDFAPFFAGQTVAGNCAFVYIHFTASENGDILSVNNDNELDAFFGVGADWYYEAWIDGQPAHDTLTFGNGCRDFSFTNHKWHMSLKPGKHLLVIRLISGSAGSILCVDTLNRSEIEEGPLSERLHKSSAQPPEPYAYMMPRDMIKLAFQYQETEHVPYCFNISRQQADALTQHYGTGAWREKIVDYIGHIAGVGHYMHCKGLPGGLTEDSFGCVWQMGSIHHLEAWPLQEPRMGDYRLPSLKPYFKEFLHPQWLIEIPATAKQFRIITHTFGLFERAWSLRGFENFLMDMAAEEVFAEELLETITNWILTSIDLMAAAPVDAIMLTDDHAAQRGMIMGAARWRKLFKPRWKRIFDRIHHHGLYTILHMCGDTSEVVPDLIEIGLDCMESCQPECMDIYQLKKQYGRDIRFWGGLGAQSALPFGTADDVRKETAHLKKEMGRGGGYILAGSKSPDEKVPVANIVAFFEEAVMPGV